MEPVEAGRPSCVQRECCAVFSFGEQMPKLLLAAAFVAVTAISFFTDYFTITTTAVLAATMMPSANVKPLLHSIAEVMAVLSCSRSTVYVLINTGRLEAVKILGATRITDASMQRLLSSAPKAQIAGNALAAPPAQSRKRSSRAAA